MASVVLHIFHDPVWVQVEGDNVYLTLSLHLVSHASHKNGNSGNWVVSHDIFADVYGTLFMY